MVLEQQMVNQIYLTISWKLSLRYGSWKEVVN